MLDTLYEAIDEFAEDVTAEDLNALAETFRAVHAEVIAHCASDGRFNLLAESEA